MDEKVDTVVDSLVRGCDMEDAFCGFIVHSEENEQKLKEIRLDSVKKLFTSLSEMPNPQSRKDAITFALHRFITRFHQINNSSRGQMMMNLLDGLVENSTVPSKTICEALLKHEMLTHTRLDKWCQCFELIQRIIGGVDYKGCRDILRMILEKSRVLPVEFNVAALEAAEVMNKVVANILNRNACLLPAYLALSEISKLQQLDHAPWPYWKLGNLLADFIQTFRSVAHMVSVLGRSSLVPLVGVSSITSNMWRLSSNSLKFLLQGPLPYGETASEPQQQLLCYVLKQQYSREMVCNMLNLNKQLKDKQRCVILEEQLAELVVSAMEAYELSSGQAQSSSDETGGAVANGDGGGGQLMWHHLSGQLIYFILFQFASFPHVVAAINDKLKIKRLSKARDQLMWILLQFISGSFHKNPVTNFQPLDDFLPVIQLYDQLYQEKVPLPIEDALTSFSPFSLAPTCIWIHLMKKAQQVKVDLHRPLPSALALQAEYLKDALDALNNKTLQLLDVRIALLCNAYSTSPDNLQPLMKMLVDSICGNDVASVMLPMGVAASAPTQPIPVSFLDSLTVHAKMSLLHQLATRFVRDVQNRPTKKGPTLCISPALLETYSRLLVYIEIESLGIKGYISHVLPVVSKNQAWDTLHSLIEMVAYRLMHIHIQPHYRLQLLNFLNALALPPTSRNQLHICIESAMIRLITSLGSWEVHQQLPRLITEMKIVSADSEEINRLIVLTLARTMQVTGFESGTSFQDILTSIVKQTPHSWSSHTIACFPAPLADFFTSISVPREQKASLKRAVDAEYRNWKSMASENDLVNHFSTVSTGTSTVFLCILWKGLFEDNRVSPTAWKVLDRLGPKALAAHLRSLADYLIYEFSQSTGGQHINKCIEALNDLIWKWGVVPIDRMVLSLALRHHEGDEAKVCFFIVQMLLSKSNEFRMRVQDFLAENSPEHWRNEEWFTRHSTFHQKYPEKMYYEALQDLSQAQGQQTQQQYLPIHFSNMCLRVLPMLDIVLHRLLELSPPAIKTLDDLLETLGPLYQFHDQPMTFLYNTLHYYEKKLRDKPGVHVRKKLIQNILGAFKGLRSSSWCVCEEFSQYLQTSEEDAVWTPSHDYYASLVASLVNVIRGQVPPALVNCDWRFNEFSNASAHVLHSICIELMGLPVSGPTVGAALFSTVTQWSPNIPREDIGKWMNAVGLILTALPESYLTVLHERIVDALQHPSLQSTSGPVSLSLFNFTESFQVMAETPVSITLAVTHAVWLHASIGQLSVITSFLREKVKPIVKSEAQFLFVCHLIGPFLQRFSTERTRCLWEITVLLYELLEVVDRASEHLHHMDTITDFLYHIKYMFVGDSVKSEVEKVVRGLRLPLQLRLRFIAHQGKDEQTGVISAAE